MKALRLFLLALIICALPLFFMSTTVRWLASEVKLYEYGFSKYQISGVTGISDAELIKVAGQLTAYFSEKVDSPQVTVNKGNTSFAIFNEKELIHLEDVLGLLRLAFAIQLTALLVIMAGVVLSAIKKSIGWGNVLKGFFWGSVATCGLMGILVLVAIFGFDRFFLLFHLISFSNDLWILDPSKDYLIMLFPSGFFYDAALFWFIAVLVKAIITGGLAFGLLRFLERKKKQRYTADKRLTPM